MKTKEDIYSEMILEAPWHVGDHLKPYILEAMQLFAESYYKERMKANGAEQGDSNCNIPLVSRSTLPEGFKVYKCTDCGAINVKRDNGEIRVGFCDECEHPLWN